MEIILYSGMLLDTNKRWNESNIFVYDRSGRKWDIMRCKVMINKEPDDKYREILQT